MAVTQSPRVGLTRWGAGTDPLRRSQLDADNAALDNLVAIDLQVATINDRPAAGTRGRYCFVESTGLVYRDDGATWVAVGAAPDLTPYARKDGATFTGDVNLTGARTTLGDANPDVVRRHALEVEVDTRNVTNGYTNGKLTSVVEKDGATTVKTTTLGYTGDQLTTVTEVADGLTITTTLTYDGAGVLTGTTRSVA